MVTVVPSFNLPPRTHKAGWRLPRVIKCVLGGNIFGVVVGDKLFVLGLTDLINFLFLILQFVKLLIRFFN